MDVNIFSPHPSSSSTRRCTRDHILDMMVGLGAAILITYLYLSLASLVWLDQKLEPWTFSPLPLGSILPSGWLRSEMETMADGLAGHEYDFYISVKKSRWLFPDSGVDYSILNEALPYWFNGLVPLAYLLHDERLITQVDSVASAVLKLQHADGWLGPEKPGDRNFWGRAPFLLGLTQLVEVNQEWEVDVLRSLRRFMDLANTMLHNNGEGIAICPPDYECYWGQVRVADLIITIQWLLAKYPSEQDALLWENMALLYRYTEYKWVDFYQQDDYPKVVSNPTTSNPQFPFLHGVNAGQGLKSLAVVRRFTHNDSLVDASIKAVNWTFTYHGAPSGTVLGDEIQRDLAPFSGSELCTAVETGYSLAYLYHALGTNYYADRAELVIYNALPAMMTGDHWAHQYMAQPNQPWVVFDKQEQSEPHIFTTTHSGVATTFGMEPQYPCCTVNHPQGFPKFVANSWGYVGENGLAHILLGPSLVSHPLASILCETNYPFNNTLTYTVTTNQTAGFNLYLRVPTWYIPGQSSVKVDGVVSPLSPDPETGMHRISILPGFTNIKYTIGTAVRTEERPNGTVSVYYGNLLYALDVGQTNSSSLPHAYNDPNGPGLDYLPFPQLRDYYIENIKPWNVAIGLSTLEYVGLPVGDRLPDPVFQYPSNDQGSSYILVDGCEIEWGLYLGRIPGPPPPAGNRTCRSARQTYKLIPYGQAKLHMSELPTITL